MYALNSSALNGNLSKLMPLTRVFFSRPPTQTTPVNGTSALVKASPILASMAVSRRYFCAERFSASNMTRAIPAYCDDNNAVRLSAAQVTDRLR